MLWVQAQLPTLAILRAHALLRGPKDLSLLSGRAPAFYPLGPTAGVSQAPNTSHETFSILP